MVQSSTACGVLLVSAMISGAAHGDALFGVYAGAGQWQQSYSGDVASGGEEVDVERDLDLDDERNNVFYVAVEHGVPVLPNLRMNHAEVSGEGRHVLTRTIVFDGEIFTVGQHTASQVQLTQTDAVLYYQLLDNVLSLDLGIAARWVDGEVEVSSGSEVAGVEFKGVLPLLYGRARVDLPLTGLWVGAEAMGLAYDGHQLVDASAHVGWESPIGLGAELGWRSMLLDLDAIDDIDSADIEISGPYAALNFHF